MAKYVYPALFHPEEGGYFIEFPDLEGCFTQGSSLQDGLEMAQDVLSLCLVDLEDDQAPIPAPSHISNIKTEGEAFSTLVSCDTTAYRRLMNKSAVKKTLSIPAWLNESATAAGINFSQVLQEALKQKLQV